MRLYTDTGKVSIPVRDLSPAQLRDLKHDLKFSNGAFYQAEKRGISTDNISRFIYGYTIIDGEIRIPRHVNWKKYGLKNPCPTWKGRQIRPVVFTGALRDNQIDAYAALRDQIARGQDGILSLSCGFGKTFLAVKAWADMPRHTPCIVAVTTLPIADGWKRCLLKFTDTKEHEIGMIGGKGDGKWQGKKFVIAIINSLAQKTFPESFYQYFGLFISDECHRMGAETFSVVGGQFYCQRIGLSATWKRADGMERLFMLHLGKVFYEDHSQAIIPDIYFLKSPIRADMSKFRMWNPKTRRRQGDLNYALAVTFLSQQKDRQMFIGRHVKQALDQGRKVLVIGDRKEELVHLQLLMNSIYDVPAQDTGLCVGSLNGRIMNTAARDEALSRPLTFATSHLVKEGLDQPDIDTLFILSPQSNAAFAEQAAGRILRVHDGKSAPIIVVMCDSGAYLKESLNIWHNNIYTKIFPFLDVCKRMQKTFQTLNYNIMREAS